MKKIALILCGSGFKDGSEIRESVAVLWAISQEGAESSCFALHEPQSDVVNCLTGEVVPSEQRLQIVEAARIARGQVQSLTKLKASDFDALVIPGGFGAAKNLCSFAGKGSNGVVHPEVNRVLQEFHSSGKPIGAVCIAPAILALAFPKKGLELTLGEKGEAVLEIEKLGHKHIEKAAHEWHCDRHHKVVSTPAYMFDAAPLRDIFRGIHGLVHELCSF